MKMVVIESSEDGLTVGWFNRSVYRPTNNIAFGCIALVSVMLLMMLFIYLLAFIMPVCPEHYMQERNEEEGNAENGNGNNPLNNFKLKSAQNNNPMNYNDDDNERFIGRLSSILKRRSIPSIDHQQLHRYESHRWQPPSQSQSQQHSTTMQTHHRNDNDDTDNSDDNEETDSTDERANDHYTHRHSMKSSVTEDSESQEETIFLDDTVQGRDLNRFGNSRHGFNQRPQHYDRRNTVASDTHTATPLANEWAPPRPEIPFQNLNGSKALQPPYGKWNSRSPGGGL